MATNAKNIAELLNTDTTVKVGDIEDGSVTTAKLAANAVTSAKALNLGRRNLIFNGDMQIAQRTTSASSVTGAGYPSVDRYNMNLASLGTWTVSQSTTTPSEQGFTKSLKLDCTTADASPSAGDYFLFEQRIEAQNLQHLCYGTSSAKSLTLSFWVRSNKTGTYYTEIQHGDAGSNYFNNHSYTISAANTWEKKTIPVTGQTDAIINNDNGIGMFVRWCVGAGSNFTSGTTTNNTWHQTAANRFAGQVNLADNTNNEWYVTGAQLEIGSASTDFEHRSFGEELALCQRYFYKTYDYDDAVGTGTAHGAIFSRVYGNSAVSNVPQAARYKVTMRGNPTVTVYSLNGTSGNISDCGTGYSHTADDAIGISGTNGHDGWSKLNSVTVTAGDVIALHFTAEAEL